VNPTEVPVWSPDGSQLAWFGYDATNTPKIFLATADGKNITYFGIPDSLLEALRLAWSPDGGWLAFKSSLQAGGLGLYVIRADGSDAQLVSPSLMEDSLLRWSPVVNDQP
jgi:Tol biopolymer transport system component